MANPMLKINPLWLQWATTLCIAVITAISVSAVPWALDVNEQVTRFGIRIENLDEQSAKTVEAIEALDALLHRTREELLASRPDSGSLTSIHGQLNVMTITVERIERRLDEVEKAMRK